MRCVLSASTHHIYMLHFDQIMLDYTLMMPDVEQELYFELIA